jgi:hypothetical protein
MYFLLVEVCCNAKKDAYQDDVNCKVPSWSKLQKAEPRFVSKSRNNMDIFSTKEPFKYSTNISYSPGWLRVLAWH